MSKKRTKCSQGLHYTINVFTQANANGSFTREKKRRNLKPSEIYRVAGSLCCAYFSKQTKICDGNETHSLIIEMSVCPGIICCFSFPPILVTAFPSNFNPTDIYKNLLLTSIVSDNVSPIPIPVDNQDNSQQNIVLRIIWQALAATVSFRVHVFC